MEQLQPVGMYNMVPSGRSLEAEEDGRKRLSGHCKALWLARPPSGEGYVPGMLTEFYGGIYLHGALLQAYGGYEQEKSGKIWIMGEENAFPGGSSPLRAMEKRPWNVGQEEVHYNQCYVLCLRKSVAYLAVLTRNKDEICASICASAKSNGLSNGQIGIVRKGTAMT